ncbi:MAG TPA: hypothetical protein VEX68_17195 [Bryobacteraceae bacterium]|nr:hypothetical protein [Bryobacteraceae bacterium]
MRSLLLTLLATTLVAYQGKKAPQLKPPLLDVIDLTAQRDQALLVIDCKLKNTGERPAEKLVIIVDVLDSDKRAITTQKGGSDPESIEPGEHAEFNAQMRLPPRAVYVRLSFEDGAGRDVKANSAGPVAIE